MITNRAIRTRGLQRRCTLLAVIGLASLAGCSWNNQTAGDVAPGRVSSGNLGSRAASTAREMVGAPYRYGGTRPDGFDCSGLVHFAYRSAGLSVPRTSREQLEATSPVNLKDVQPGDLLFFRIQRRVSHVGIYLGDDLFVHAPSSGKRVSIETLDAPYYQARFVRAGRF